MASRGIVTADGNLSTPITVHGYGLQHAMPAGMIYRPAGMADFLVAYFHDAVTVRLRGVDHACAPGTLICWAPGEIHDFGNPAAPWKYTWMQCDGGALREQLRECGLPLSTPLVLPAGAGIERLVTEVHEEQSRCLSLRPAMLHALFTRWLLDLQWALTPETPYQIPAKYRECKAYLETHYAEPLTLSRLAERAFVSMKYFGNEFKRYFGIPPIEYLIRVRLRQAAFLVQNTNASIADIAQQVGFDNYCHFTTVFRKHFNVSPRQMRKASSDDGMRVQVQEERQRRELAQLFREGWVLVLDQDFSRDTALDPRLQATWGDELVGNNDQLPAPERVCIENGALRLLPFPHRTTLRVAEELSEEAKLEVVAVNTLRYGLNITLSISGDAFTGYRLCIGPYDQVIFETIASGQWKILYRGNHTLDPAAATFRIVLWRSGNVFYAEIDGQRVMEYHDPFALRGVRHRSCAISRWYDQGRADICSLRIFSRQAPRFVDVLEPGRVLLDLGHFSEAAAWFVHQMATHEEPQVRQEARYLAALAIPPEEAARATAALQAIVEDTDSPFRQHALRQQALVYTAQEAYLEAIAIAKQLLHLDREDGTPYQVSHAITERLREVAHPQRPAILARLAQLPLQVLDISALELTSLEPFTAMRLTDLHCGENRLTELAPLQDMPLRLLNCSGNHLRDLSPVAHLPLQHLVCAQNAIADLAPLATRQLSSLLCAHNRLTDLAPLANLPLVELGMNDNQVTSLAPLRAMPLHTLECSQNAISDLSPLRSLPLDSLYCAENPIDDLTPLAGLPITRLSIGDIPLTARNIHVLRTLPLRNVMHDLRAHIALDLAQGATLHLINDHQRAHYRRVAEPVHAALCAWHAGAPPPVDLRAYAWHTTSRAYLALPQRLSWADAEAFARWAGARLCTLEAPGQYAQVHQYLTSVSYAGITIYALGLRTDADGVRRWMTGAPYAAWRTPIPLYGGIVGTVGFLVPTSSTVNPHIAWRPPTTTGYPLLEWEV